MNCEESHKVTWTLVMGPTIVAHTRAFKSHEPVICLLDSRFIFSQLRPPQQQHCTGSNTGLWLWFIFSQLQQQQQHHTRSYTGLWLIHIFSIATITTRASHHILHGTLVDKVPREKNPKNLLVHFKVQKFLTHVVETKSPPHPNNDLQPLPLRKPQGMIILVTRDDPDVLLWFVYVHKISCEGYLDS